MNEETKNTLDYINEFMNAPLEQIYLNRKRIKLVLNYITDLQQENARLKEELKYTVPMVEHNKIVSEKLKENARLKEERKQIKEYVEKCNFDNAEILYDFGNEYCYIDDFKEHILEILKEN